MAFTLNVEAGLIDVIPLLEDLYYADVSLSETPLEAWGSQSLSAKVAVLPERHQLIFAGATESGTVPSHDTLQRLVYRADLASRPGSDAIRHPAELNRRATSIGAVGSYVSVIAGHQDYIENTVFLSAAQIVGSASALCRIRERAYGCVCDFRDSRDETRPVRQRRLTFERIADLLGELELELSFSVEATADLGLLVPSLRVEGYHNDLYESMNLVRRAETASNMLARLRNATQLSRRILALSVEQPGGRKPPPRVLGSYFSTNIGPEDRVTPADVRRAE